MPTHRKSPQPREPRRAPSGQPRQPERTRRHPLYGEIPLVEVVRQDPGGEVRYLDYDRDYSPPIPQGAVRGDVAKQHFCPICHVPRYFYVDQERPCVECGRDFVFSAREQKYWYEDLRFHFDSVAIRCPECRRKQRTRKTLNAAVARAKSRLAAEPADPERALAVAEALVRLNEHTGEGDLKEALALARKAGRSASKGRSLQAEAHFWEGKAQVLLGRHDRATPLFQAALEALPTNKRRASLRAEAGWYLSTASREESEPGIPLHDSD
ncbi:MAG TPA: zinc-ribbon domain-containing protein [Thermoanaerobaculia bacterium]|nr:zinc-ribbon domain-containing protein [Thermoanaerobaculia bacterium]